MRKLLLFILLLFSFQIVKAQINASWNIFYEQLYGSKQEYRSQVELRENMGYELYHLIGYKSYYTNGPSGFLQQIKDCSLYTVESGGRLIYTLIAKDEKGKPSKFHLAYWLDHNDRVTKARFTGDPSLLTWLFINYWPDTSRSGNPLQPKKGTIAEKHFNSERIVFNYKGNNPFIEIKQVN